MAAYMVSRCLQVSSLSANRVAVENIFSVIVNRLKVQTCTPASKCFHTSTRRRGLDEFFEDKQHWGEEKVECGRPWKLDELRIKSNEDLHKLWYVLLKERNMLMTMEHEYNRACELFPNPERLDKVDESMKNLLSVVDERNEAYNLLETGKTGKPEMVEKRNVLGLRMRHPAWEHIIPPYMNTMHKALHPGYTRLRGQFLKLYAEKLRKRRIRAIKLEQNRVAEIKKRFPHVDIEPPDFK